MSEENTCADMFGWNEPWDVPLHDIVGTAFACRSRNIFAFTGDPEPDNPWVIVGTKTKEEAVDFLILRMHPDVKDPEELESIKEELREQVEPWGG